VTTGQGMSFWSHYCVSPGYWMLLPAHAAMFAAGAWLRRGYGGVGMAALGRLAAAVVVATAACHLLAQGGFYWLSSAVAEPTMAGWARNYGHWFLPYLSATAMFVALAALAQVVAEAVTRHGGSSIRAGGGKH
jgi:hypothetical protein